MDLPDCPPGAEGYQDSVVEVPKKPDDTECTKAEAEFQEHLTTLKIKLENNETRCMVERRERGVSGKWIYLCYPCAAVCSGEPVLQTHLLGKKHKMKLSTRTVWPLSIFVDHPFNQTQKVAPKKEAPKEEKTQNDPFNYDKLLEVPCHLQEALDSTKAPLLGLEYLVEHPPEQAHYEPAYLCTLCTKQGHPRTIINHLTCFWHRFNYLNRHFHKATNRLNQYKNQSKYREGVSVMLHRLSQRIEDKYGRLKPINIDKDLYEKEKINILQWIFKQRHFSENDGPTFEEVVDTDLMESLVVDERDTASKEPPPSRYLKKDPSPPRVAAPLRPTNNSNRSDRPQRRLSLSSLSDISDDEPKRPSNSTDKNENRSRASPSKSRGRVEPQNEPPIAFRSRYAIRHIPDKEEKHVRAPNHEYKIKLIDDKCKLIEESSKKMLAYHEKNPEKHPLYPDEWKKFWNRRYKEIQTEGKDPSKHDFKPEWIVFWTKRMKELHEEEVRVQVTEVYRKMNVPPPDFNKQKIELNLPTKQPARDVKDDRRGKREHDRRHSPERRYSPDRRRRSPERRARRSPEPRKRSLERKPSTESRRYDRRTPRDVRSPRRRSPPIDRAGGHSRYHRSPSNRDLRSPPRKRTKSRSPIPQRRRLSPIRLDSMERRRSRSPLSLRATELPLRNRSPAPASASAPSPLHLAPSMQTVLVSDDEFKPDDGGLSPWNSDNEICSMGSRSENASIRSRMRAPSTSYRAPSPDTGAADNVIATLRTLVALEDYLGSLGPKIVDLLTEAITMEKDRANSSEELLERESAVVLIETAKEKLKGAAQAGLVAPGAVHAVRAAVVRAAATLHEADLRAKKTAQNKKQALTDIKKSEPLPVAGVGEVDRAQIARQMAAALIAQGKTDVTSDELAQLVDAVVGMAEAKKRKAEAQKKVEKIAPVQAKSTATSALQLLQSAYDENDKKVEKEEAAVDAMDGLSDSDLETLLKNFNELSAEEQHSLIAYLKKLEAREPLRVEKLRQYVTAAASAPPKQDPPVKKSPEKELAPVTIESDDDDYSVEDVFKSATEKVKENQIRQEMEIVKKSLEENKIEIKSTPPPELSKNVSQNLTSATDLFALVQASIQSTAANTPAPVVDVVASGIQPRSFGDLAEPLTSAALVEPSRPIPDIASGPNQFAPNQSGSGPNQSGPNQSGSNPSGPNQINFNGNFQSDSYDQSNSFQSGSYPNEPFNNQPDSYQNNDLYQNNYNQSDSFNQNEPFNQQGGYGNSYNQGDLNQNEQFHQNQFSQNEPFNQPWNSRPFNNQGPSINSGPFNNFGPRGPSTFNPGANKFNSGPNFNSGPSNGPNFKSGPGNGPNFNSGPGNGPNFNSGPGNGPNFNFGPVNGPNPFNSGPPGNFRKQDNFNNKPDNNQNNRNFRGRGGNRGGRGNQNRGRGRGRF